MNKTNAQKIEEWREENSLIPLNADILKNILGLSNLAGIDLDGANLQGANLNGAYLNGAYLNGADLYGANLREADLYGADLRGANLRRANLRGANLRGANLREADLNGANLQGANLDGADLYGANLSCTRLEGATLADIRLNGVNLYRSTMKGFTFENIPSGDGHFIATPDGWRITIGCWKNRTLEELRELLNNPESEFPEARGHERERRTPILKGLLAMCEAFAEAHPGAVGDMQLPETTVAT